MPWRDLPERFGEGTKVVVGVGGEMLKHLLPDTAFGPTAEPEVDLNVQEGSTRAIPAP
jgi:hypothetical protein